MKFEALRSRRRLFAVNHPRYAEAIHQHPEFRRPECLLQWHLHFPPAANSLKIRSASAGSFVPTESEKPLGSS